MLIILLCFRVIVFLQHEYQDSQANFKKESTVLSTCNQQTAAAFNPDKFQPVELKSEEVLYY